MYIKPWNLNSGLSDSLSSLYYFKIVSCEMEESTIIIKESLFLYYWLLKMLKILKLLDLSFGIITKLMAFRSSWAVLRMFSARRSEERRVGKECRL